jgi:hypothetical protein
MGDFAATRGVELEDGTQRVPMESVAKGALMGDATCYTCGDACFRRFLLFLQLTSPSTKSMGKPLRARFSATGGVKLEDGTQRVPMESVAKGALMGDATCYTWISPRFRRLLPFHVVSVRGIARPGGNKASTVPA